MESRWDLYERLNQERAAVYYISLLKMREAMKQSKLIAPNEECPIYVQDTLLREPERAVLEANDIHVLSGAYGHQQAFTEINESTMVVHFSNYKGDSSLLGLIMEIACPAVLVWPNGITAREKDRDEEVHLDQFKPAAGIKVSGDQELGWMPMPTCHM